MVDGNSQGYAATGAATVSVSPIAAMPHKTLFHEIAHVLLHHGADDTERSLREVEAECVAMSCESLGLEHYSHVRMLAKKAAVSGLGTGLAPASTIREKRKRGQHQLPKRKKRPMPHLKPHPGEFSIQLSVSD